MDLFAAQTRTVLVVDPSPTERDLIQSILQKEHFHIIFADDTSSILASIAAYHPHLILLSIHQLAHVDGYHICQIIRKQPHLTRLPVILFGKPKAPSSYVSISGLAGPTDLLIARGRLAGSTDFLVKPFDTHQLVQMVKKHIPA